MEISLSTPTLLFSAISLLVLAYTNRFLALASLIRELHAQLSGQPDDRLQRQILNLRRRVRLIRNMQAVAVGSLLLCGLCMLLVFAGQPNAASVAFGLGLLLFVVSLVLSLREIWLSTDALDAHLEDLSGDSTGAGSA